MKMQKNDDLKVGIGISNGEDKTAITIDANKVTIPTIIDISKLKEIPEYKPLNHPPFMYATQIHGVPVVVHENGQLLIIASTTGKKRDLIVKHINSLIKEGLVELRQVEKERYFIDNKMICDIKKLLKVNE
jgi:hypothetical protein